MNFKRIALFAIGWFLLQGALMMAAFYVLFTYQGNALLADPADGASTVSHYVSLMEVGMTVANFLVYLLFLRVLQGRLILHALVLFISLEIMQLLFALGVEHNAAAITGENAPVNLYDWLPVWGKDLAIALLAVAVVSGVRRYKSRTALRQTNAEPPQEG